MAIPKDELSLLVRDWYYAASEGQVEAFLSFFLQSEKTTYFGTDPQELWYGYDEIKANFEDNFRTYGKWSIMSKNLIMQEFGGVAVFTDDVELAARHGEASMAEEARMTGTLVQTDGKWKIVQAHFSIGVSNKSLLPT